MCVLPVSNQCTESLAYARRHCTPVPGKWPIKAVKGLLGEQRKCCKNVLKRTVSEAVSLHQKAPSLLHILAKGCLEVCFFFLSFASKPLSSGCTNCISPSFARAVGVLFFSLSCALFGSYPCVGVCVSVAISRLQPVLLVFERTQRCAPHSAILDGEMYMFALHWLQ